MFQYVRLPRQTFVFIAFNIILLVRQIYVANGACAEDNLPTRKQIIRGNLDQLSEMFSNVIDRHIRISSDLTDAQIEGLFVRFAEVAPIEARDFLDFITASYDDAVETWLRGCKTQMPGKRGSVYQEDVQHQNDVMKSVHGSVYREDEQRRNDVMKSSDSYSTIMEAINKRDPKHPLYRLPRSPSAL